MGFAHIKCITSESDFVSRCEALFRASDSWRAQQHLCQMLGDLPFQLQPLVDFDYMSVLLTNGGPPEPSWYILDEDNPSALRLSQELPVEHAHMFWAIDHQQPAVVSGLQQEPAFSNASRSVNDRGVQSGCAVPLTTGDRQLGAIFFGRERIRPLLDEEIRFLSLVADRIARAIDQTEQEESIDRPEKEGTALSGRIDLNGMFEEIVGSSGVLQRVLGNVMRVAMTTATVLITGESGTGKELIARAIHKRSQRSGRPFVRVNCAAIPPSLIASELFGYEKGAFTGAVQRHLGRFEVANGGTIFLDEIGDIPPETQIALLRVLQERELERVGGTHPISVDVRVIAATNCDLPAAIAEGRFRRDLFYRLNVFPVEIPALRERLQDIPVLATHFIARSANTAGKKIRRIERQTMNWLQEHDWPGNIRELQNIVERAVILCDGDILCIERDWLRSEKRNTPGPPLALSTSLSTREKGLIEAALEECKGRIAGPAGAANKLGMPRTTLESKMKKLRINKYLFRCAPAA